MILYIISVVIAGNDCLLEKCSSGKENKKTLETNIVGTPLLPCGTDPMTGFYRDSYCRTGENDRGTHVVCAEMTAQFLRYTKDQGNDLQTPSPKYGFPGLRPGQRWCLCASRWLQAYNNGVAPPVLVKSTQSIAIKTIPVVLLEEKSQSSRKPAPD